MSKIETVSELNAAWERIGVWHKAMAIHDGSGFVRDKEILASDTEQQSDLWINGLT